MRIFILSLFGIGVFLALVCGFVLFVKNSKIESIRKQLKERGIKTDAAVISKEYKKTRRIIYITGRLQNFDSFKLKLKFNAKSKNKKKSSAISFDKALKGEESVSDLGSKFVEFDKPVGQKMYDALEKGDKVPILFLPDQPKDFEVLDSNDEFTPNLLFWISIGCFTFSCVSLLMFIQYYRTGTTF